MTNLYAKMMKLHIDWGIDDLVDWLSPYHEIAGDATQLWYEHVCRRMRDKGMLSDYTHLASLRIFLDLATVAVITQDFQSILLAISTNHEYGEYLDELTTSDLEELYHSYVNDADDEDWREDCNDEDDLRDQLSERLIESNRQRIVDELGIGKQGGEDLFVAIVLTVRFPYGDFEDYADRIEATFPVKVEDLRERTEFASYEEYKKYLASDDSSAFVYAANDGDLGIAYGWWNDGCSQETLPY